MKKILVVLAIVSSTVMIAGIALLYFADESETHSIATLKTKSGYVFDIRIPGFWEVTAPLLCIITKDKETIFSQTTIGYARGRALDKYTFALIESGEKNDLVAIIEQTNPQIVLAIYDLKNHKWWGESEAVRQELLEKLKQQTGKSFFWPGETEAKEPQIFHYSIIHYY